MDYTEITLGGLTLYEIIWFFLIYSFVGWVLEVAYAGVAEGRVVNRGFLNGPVCPIYGIGMDLFLMLLNTVFPVGAVNVNGFLLFAIGLVLATGIELLGGWLLKKIFNMSWWDYSDKPFNFHGYICLEFSLLWGLGAVFVIRILHPFIAEDILPAWPEEAGWPAAAVFLLIYAVDLIITVMIVIGLNEQLEELDSLRSSMRVVSDELSAAIGTGSIKTAQQVETGREKAADIVVTSREKAADIVVTGREKAADIVVTGREKAADAAVGLKEQAVQTSAKIGAHGLAVKESLGNQIGSIQSRIGAGVQDIKERTQALLDRMKELQAEEDTLYTRLTRVTLFGPRRLLDAFPKLSIPSHKGLLDELKQRIANKKAS